MQVAVMIGVSSRKVIKMSRDEFIEIMQILLELYPNQFSSFKDKAMNMWYECLNDLNFSRTTKAIACHIREKKYAPTISDIREQYYILLDEERKNPPRWQ